MAAADSKTPIIEPPACKEHRDREVRKAQRVNVWLIQEANDALRRLQLRTGLNRADVINRALQVYDYLNEEMFEGKKVLIKDEQTGEVEKIKFL